MGVSQGFPWFICVGGAWVYVARELGLLPEGYEVGGVCLENVVAALCFAIPISDGCALLLQIFPAEYLTDPVLPGLPPGLSVSEELRLLPPPPLFSTSNYVDGVTGLAFSRVEYQVSAQEEVKGGGTMFGFTHRGWSYYSLHSISP